MRTYQTLSLIGCIIGILLTIGLALVVGGLMSASNVLMNMSRSTENELQQHTESQKGSSIFIGGAIIAFFIYIIILVVTFAVKKKTKAVGITILILGIITMAITNLWGIVPFALLLPASIVALRYKHRSKGPGSIRGTGPPSATDSNSKGQSNSGYIAQSPDVTRDIPSGSASTMNNPVDVSQLSSVIPIPTEDITSEENDEQDEDDDDDDEDEK